MLKFGRLPDGNVARSQEHLDVMIFECWKLNTRSRRARVSLCSFVVGLGGVLFGMMSNDRGAQFMLSILVSAGSYIFAQRLFDLFGNYHKCGGKLKLYDVYVADADRVILRSQKEILNLKETCKIAETLECVQCQAFCYIRTHDGV